MKAGNVFENVFRNVREEEFRTLAKGERFRLVRIVSTGQATPEDQWYDQSEAEWVVILKGRAGLRVEGEKDVRDLRGGDFIMIPPHVRHRVEWTDDNEPTIWLAIHFEQTAD